MEAEAPELGLSRVSCMLGACGCHLNTNVSDMLVSGFVILGEDSVMMEVISEMEKLV